MNLRNVLRTYGLLRQLSDDETALLNTLRGMSDSERELLVELLQPQKTATKKHKRATKSAHAASLATAISGTTKPQLCAFVMDNNDTCQGTENDAIHDKSAGYAGYHPFAPPAQSAGKRSSPSGEGQPSIASSETGKGAASPVARGAGGGD